MLAFGLTLVAFAACGGGAGPDAHRASASNDRGSEPAIATEWRARCGACHVKVEPHSRDRSVLTKALARHRSRAKLNEEQWTALVDFLAR
jgi:hypothetical protein